MEQATPLKTVTSSVNERQFLEQLKTFFSTSTIMLAEAMQNARRAGAKEVWFDYEADTATLTIRDYGRGIEDFQTLLTVAASDWSQQTIDDEKPFGMGFYSICFAAERVLVQSRGQQVSFTLDDLIEKRPIAIEPSEMHEGTLITLYGCKLDEGKMEQSIKEYAKGFPIPVIWRSLSLPRPHARQTLRGTETPVGFIHAAGIHDAIIPNERPGFTLYCQGLPIHLSGYARNREYDTYRVIIHVDHRRFLPRMPDRDVLTDSDRACEDFDSEVSALWRSFLKKRKARLSARRFASQYWSVARAIGCLELMRDVPVLPVSILSQIEETPIKLHRYADSFFRQPRSPVTQAMVENREVLLFRDFHYRDQQEECNYFARLMWAKKAKALFVRNLPAGHWAEAYVRDLFEMPVSIEGNPLGERRIEAEWVSALVILFDSLNVTMDGVSYPLDEAIVANEVRDSEGETVTGNAILVPKGGKLLGDALRQASEYTNGEDSFREDALDRDLASLEQLVAILSGEAPEITLEKFLRSSGVAHRCNLKSHDFIIKFNASGQCAVTRCKTARGSEY